jgi:ABC-type multidrug transport system ATPase subunit
MDEPLQFVDEEKINKVMEMLTMMPAIYKFVFIISHISDLKQIISIPLHINVLKDGSSFINNCEIKDSKENIKKESIEEVKEEYKKELKEEVNEEKIEESKEESKEDMIKCDLCQREVKKKSYLAHTKSAIHLKNMAK